MALDDVLKKLGVLTGCAEHCSTQQPVQSQSGNWGTSGYYGSMGHTALGGCSSGMSGYSGYTRQGYSEQEMVDAFLAGYKAFMLIDEEIKPEIIEMAKKYVKTLL